MCIHVTFVCCWAYLLDTLSHPHPQHPLGMQAHLCWAHGPTRPPTNCPVLVLHSRAGMEEAIRAKHNTDLEGRKISVKEAIPQEQIPPGKQAKEAGQGVWWCWHGQRPACPASMHVSPTAGPVTLRTPQQLSSLRHATGQCLTVTAAWFELSDT